LGDWFVVNVRDAPWVSNGAFGDACDLESDAAPFEQVGINVRVLWPGRTRWLYHAEEGQEAFLVVTGECLLLIEEEERPLRAWDFVHCPPGTAHAFVATGDGPCVVVMVGARGGGIFYPRSELALRHGVGVEHETTSPRDAQAQLGTGEWQLVPLPRGPGIPWA
jgi:uncharacterized cupin superfamily protein